MTNEAIRDLIERVEAGVEAEQYNLLCAAFEAIKGPIRDTTTRPGITRWHDDWFVFERKMEAFAFESAAMSLVPKGWGRSVFDADNGDALAGLEFEGDVPSADIEVHARGKTWTLALCAASLRAHLTTGA